MFWRITTYKVYLGPKPASSIQAVKLVVVSSAEASRLGAVDTCLAFSESRAIICSERLEISIGDQVANLLKDHLARHQSVKTDPIAAAVAKAGPVVILYSSALGLVEFVILHELAHVYHRDSRELNTSNATSVAGLCGGPDPAIVSNELVADSIAIDMLSNIESARSPNSPWCKHHKSWGSDGATGCATGPS
jgi:hypothetical protein